MLHIQSQIFLNLEELDFGHFSQISNYNNYEAFLKFCLIIILHSHGIAQSSINGLYTNETDGFICFDNDNVRFRIYNNDAFGTFTIGKGKFEFDKRGRVCILQSNSILSQTSSLKKYPRNDNCIGITVLKADM